MSTPGPGPRPYFFISRAGEDAEWAVWIAGVLRAAGHDHFVQDADIQAGHSFVVKMREAMERATCVICVLTPEYLAKEFTMAEMDAAFRLDPKGEKRMLIIVQVKECEPPRLYSHFVYLNLKTRDEQARRSLLAVVTGQRPFRKSEHRTFISKLPAVNPTLIGRDEQLGFLDRACADPATNFVQIIAAGGTGKTALADKWLRRHLDEATTFGWSFYSQGTSENRQTSSDPFFAEIIAFFGIEIAPAASVYAKAEAIARRLRDEQVLLILDGIEPLQDSTGAVRDAALKALLRELAAHNRGMVLCTTRLRITDVPDDPAPALSIDLDNLDPEHGAEYLRELRVQGKEEELREASADYGNHALALTLLGTYLVDFCDADVRRRVEIPALMTDDTELGAHARRVMNGYLRMFAGKPEIDILRALGYFDRPVEQKAIRLVLRDMSDRTYRLALKRLHEARLVLSPDPARDLDCHPLIREHFADLMRTTAPEEFRDGHSRLYEYYCKEAKHRPDTLEEMTPLFHAVYHGCRADRRQEALDAVFYPRILRGDKFYATSRLGARATVLSLLASFFESPWTVPSPSLRRSARLFVLNQSATALKSLGRLAEAAGPLLVAAQGSVEDGVWINASLDYQNLVELQHDIGNVQEAVRTARQSIDFAILSSDQIQIECARAMLGLALHAAGLLDESSGAFAEAQHATGSSTLAYWYCDLLLEIGQRESVLRRASLALTVAERNQWPDDIGLNHISLGRCYPVGSAEADKHFELAVDYLRRAGDSSHLLSALLARGTQTDLDEVYRTASRSGMRLHLADYHLARARLDFREGRIDSARQHTADAATLIDQTGYHRRDRELAELRHDLDGPDHR